MYKKLSLLFNNYSFIQASGLLISILTTLIIIRFLPQEDYGIYIYTVAFLEFGFNFIVFGFELSINKLKKIYSLRVINFILSFSVIRLINIIIFMFFAMLLVSPVNNFLYFCLLISFAAFFNLNFLYYSEQDLKWHAVSYVISKFFFIIYVLLTKDSLNINNLLSIYCLSFMLFSIMHLVFSKINVKKIELNLLPIKDIFSKTFSFSVLRIIVFFEIYVALSLYKNFLSLKIFSMVALVITISRILVSFLYTTVTPIYKKAAINKSALLNKDLKYQVYFPSFFLVLAILLFILLTPQQFIDIVFINYENSRVLILLGVFLACSHFPFMIFSNIYLLPNSHTKQYISNRFLVIFFIAIVLFNFENLDFISSILIFILAEIFVFFISYTVYKFLTFK